MPQARDEAGNIWETDAQGNPVRLVQPAQQRRAPQAVTVGRPNPAATYEAPKAAADLANTQGTIADRSLDNQRADTALAGELYAKGLRIGANGQIEPIPGWVKPGADASGAGALTAEMRGAAMNQYGTLANLAAGVNDLRAQFDENFKGRNPLEGAGAYVPFIREQDRVFNDRSGSLTAFIATALGLTGQQFNTPAEQKLFIQSILPTAGDTDGQIQAKLGTLEELIGSARIKGRSMLGITDENDPLLADQRFNEFLKRTGGAGVAGSIPPPTAAGGGATEASRPIPAEMQAEHAAYLQENWGKLTPDGYAAFRAELDRKYEFGPRPDAYRAIVPDLNARAAQGAGPDGLNIPAVNYQLSQAEQQNNDFVSSASGGFVTGMANAGGLGIPNLLWTDDIAAIREESPTASMLGEIVGGVGGSLGAGATVGALAGRYGLTGVASKAAPIGDVAYGSIYGATQQPDDLLLGAVTGAGGAVAGNVIGSQIGKRMPRAFGPKRPDDYLNRGERAVYDAVGEVDPVVAALMEADQLGVPAMIADVAPAVNTLTGAAIRRSPEAAGKARETLFRRGQGQYDRFLGAVERDLGPIESIPQRSEDLIGQARTAAGPLYDAAYAAPGASVFQIDDLVARPSMSKALNNAVRIAREEGRDPSTIGFVFDEAGNATMTSQPSWQTIDYVKRGLDDVVESYRDKATGKLVLDTEGRAVNDTLRELLKRADTANPDYAAARAAYAGPAAERDAMRRGQDAIRLSPDQLAVNLGRASPSQVAQMRLGFQSQLGEQAGRLSNSANPFNSVLNRPAMEQRLAALYADDPDANIARLLLQRDLEGQLAGSTNRLVGNSLTAERQIADEAFGGQSLAGDVLQGALETAVTGAPVATALRSGAGRGLSGAIRDYRSLGLGRRSTELADQIVPLALNDAPADAAAGLRDIAGRAEEYDLVLQELLKSASLRAGHIGAGASAAIAAELAR